MTDSLAAPTATDWPQIGDIVVNHGAGKPPAVDHLDGRTFAAVVDGAPLTLSFIDGGLLWPEVDPSRPVPVEVFEARPGIYFVDADLGDGPRGLSMVLDLTTGRLLAIEITAPAAGVPADVLARVATRGSQSAVDVHYRHGRIESNGAEAFPRSTALVGRQYRYRYSDTHLYDHLYLSDRYYAWFCRAGPDAGLGDFEECDFFGIAPDLVLVCWREKLLPCVGITLEDHRAMRTVGKIFGADAATGRTANATVGADITLIGDISGGLVTPSPVQRPA